MDKKINWLRDFPRFAGTIIGIALTAIGGVMTLNVVLKVYVFGFTENSYFSAEEQCRFQDFAEVKEGAKPARLSAEEKKDCIDQKKQIESNRFLRQKKENLIDGAAMLLVGIPFWIIFTRRRKA